MMPKAAMIFAAGFGTRMMPLTKDRPKPMVPLAGVPMIDHAMAMVRDAGVARIVVNVHYKAEILEAHLAGTDVIVVRESPEILDTGGGLRNALSHLGEGPVWTVNADAVWGGPNPMRVLSQQWDPMRMSSLLMCVEPMRAIGSSSSGDFAMSARGQLTRGKGVIYGGVQILDPNRLSEIPEPVFSLNRLWDLHTEEGRLFGNVYAGQWCDVGTLAGLPLAEALLEEHGDV